MTREQILNSNLSPEEKQRRLNELANNNAAQGATLNSLLQVPVNQFGSPTAIRPVVTESNPKPSVNTFPLRDLPAPPNVDLPRINIAPPNTANTTNTTNVPKRGIFDRFTNAFEQANPFFAMGAEFNKMGSPRPFGSQVQADPMGAFRRAKYGDQKDTRTSYEKVAAAMGIPLQEYMDSYVRQVNPLQEEVKLTSWKTMTEKANAAREALPNIEIMESMLNDPNFDTNALSGVRKYALGVFDSLGLVDEEQRTALAQLTTFDSLSNNLVLPLVKMLGVNPTDRDLAFVQAAAPTLNKSKESNILLIKTLKIAQMRHIRYQQLYVEISAKHGSSKTHPELEMLATNQLNQEFADEVANLKQQYQSAATNQNRRAEKVE